MISQLTDTDTELIFQQVHVSDTKVQTNLTTTDSVNKIQRAVSDSVERRTMVRYNDSDPWEKLLLHISHDRQVETH